MVCLLSAAALWSVMLAVGDFPIWFYQLSRWALCAAGVTAALYLAKLNNPRLSGVYWVTAVIYNPVAPIHFSAEIWHWLNVASTIGFLAPLALNLSRWWRGMCEDSKDMVKGMLLLGGCACVLLAVIIGSVLDSKAGGPARRDTKAAAKKQREMEKAQGLMSAAIEARMTPEQKRQRDHLINGNSFDSPPATFEQRHRIEGQILEEQYGK